MPPASSPGSDLALPRATTRERAARVRYRRALMLMTMTLVVPGSAQLTAGNRQVGWAALLVDAWRLGQPLGLSMNHRRAVVGINGVLCFSVAGTLLDGANI